MYDGGRRPVGSDGSDHWHRESIAWHYKVLADNKPRFKTVLALHFTLTMAMFIRLLPTLISLLGLTPLVFMQPWNIPTPLWQWVWFSSVVFIPIGWRSMERTSIPLILLFIIGDLVLAVAPATLAIIDYYQNYPTYFIADKTTTIAGCIFLSVASQVHIFGIYIAAVLSRAYYKVHKSRKDRKFTQ